MTWQIVILIYLAVGFLFGEMYRVGNRTNTSKMRGLEYLIAIVLWLPFVVWIVFSNDAKRRN